MRKHFCKTTPTVRAQVAWEKDQTRVHKPFLKFVSHPNIFWPDLHHLPILRKRFYHHVSNLENVKAGFIFSQINLWQRVVASNWAAGYLDIWSRKGRLLSMFPIDPLYHPIFVLSIKKHRHRRNVTSHHFTSFLFTSFHFYVYSNFFGSYQLKGK